jgi:hypothetical protein
LKFFFQKCVSYIWVIIFKIYITISIWKRNKKKKWALHYFFNLLLVNNLLWITNMQPYGCWRSVCYILSVPIDFIQSSSFNWWIKMNFGFQNVVMHTLKLFVCNYDCKIMSLDFNMLHIIIFIRHHLFLEKNGLLVVCVFSH